MIAYFARHATAANILMIAMLVAGIVALYSMKRETFPDIESFEVKVKVVYPGALSADVEEAICRPLEDATDGISFLKEKRCEARDSLGSMILKMDETGDMDNFVTDVKTAVDTIDEFPEQTELPIVEEQGRTKPVVSIALVADIPSPELKDYAEGLRQKLIAIPDIASVELEGFSDRQLLIEVSFETLYQYGLSLTDILSLIRSQNIDMPVGTVETTQREYALRFMDERHTPRELAELIVVQGDNGEELRLGQFATITDTFEKSEQRVQFDGNPAALLKIKKNKIDDSLVVLNAVQHFVEEQSQLLPAGMTLTLTEDSTTIVKDRIRLLVTNGIQGLILVFAVMWLFFSLRFSFWAVMGLPVAFMGGFFVMVWAGVSINMISMVALLVALGLLMDDAIVIAESIATYLERGYSALEAATRGTQKVAAGVMSSFATTVCMFGGMLFLQGDLGQVMRVMPLTLLIVLIVSLVEAFYILPHHLYKSLSHEESKSEFKKRFDKKFLEFKEKVGEYADKAVQYRYAFVGAVVAIFIVSVSMLSSGILKFKAFPDIEGNLVQTRILMPQGTPLHRTEEVVQIALTALKKVDMELQHNESAPLIRHTYVRYGFNQDAYESGPHLATINVDLLDVESRNTSIDDLTTLWRENVGEVEDAVAISYKEPVYGPAGRAVHIRLFGLPLEKLSQASHELQRELSEYSGVVDIMDDLRPGKPEMRLSLKEGALSLGVDANSVAKQLRTAFNGEVASDIRLGQESFEVTVRLDAESRNELGKFDSFPIVNSKNKAIIPLSNVADIEPARSYARIHRINNQPTVSVFADLVGTNTEELLTALDQSFMPGLLEKYSGLKMSYEGERKNGKESEDSQRKALMLGVVGIFLLLSFQFRNYIEPIVVLVAVPLALIGVIWGHLIMGIPMTQPSILGFISLAGVVVNDSILLVEFVKMHVRKGMNVHKAASQASRDRFRAVFLTSLTTTAGLTPLMFETSLQAQVLIPIATSIVFGMITSTCLILFVIPALYAILEDIGWTESQDSVTEAEGNNEEGSQYDDNDSMPNKPSAT